MKTFLKIIGSISLTLALNLIAQAKEWRGVVPLNSTRADVVRLFGVPDSKYGHYDFKEEMAYVSYSTHLCSEGGEWDVPHDTVTSISVAPKVKLKLSDLRINLNEYEKFVGPHRTSYVNSQEGIAYSVFAPSGQVMEISYRPAAKDEHLRCPNLPAPRPCVRGGNPCPRADITDKTKPCAGPVHHLAASIIGADRQDVFTFNWTVSAGKITIGHGTSFITVDGSAAGERPIIATVEVVSSLCEACCPIEASYTIKPCRKSSAIEGRKRRSRG